MTFIELHGNHYGPDLGYQPKETLKILGDNGVTVAGICGMFSPDNDLSSNRAIQRQAAIDYIRRELDFAQAVKAGYILVVPGAVGRPQAYDTSEFFRSTETLRIVAGDFILLFACPRFLPVLCPRFRLVLSRGRYRGRLDSSGTFPFAS